MTETPEKKPKPKKPELKTFDGCIGELERMLSAAREAENRKDQLEIILAAAELHIKCRSRGGQAGIPAIEFDAPDRKSQREVDELMKSLEEPLVPGLKPVGSREQEEIDPRYADFVPEDKDMDDALAGVGEDTPEGN